MFTTDSRTENLLSDFGVQYRYSNDVKFQELDDKWSTVNLGRSQVSVDDAILEYGILMDRGSAAPAPVLWENKRTGRLEVLDGIQRLMAEELRSPARFSAYIVQTDSDVIVRKIRIFINKRLQGGYQESSDWTLAKAVECLVLDGSMTIEEVAEAGGWSPSQVRDKKAVLETNCAIVGVGGPQRLSDRILRLFAKHASKTDYESAPIQIATFANAISRMQLSAEEAEPYAREFFTVPRSKGSVHKHFNTRLKEFLADDYVAVRMADPSRKRYQPMTTEGRVLKALKSAQTAVRRAVDSGEVIEDLAEYYQVANQIKSALQQLEKRGRGK